MENTIEVRYAGVVVGRSTNVRDIDAGGAGGLFLGVPDPLPVGTVIGLKVGEKVVEAWVDKVFESADAERAGMRIQLSDRADLGLFGEPVAGATDTTAAPRAAAAPPAAAPAPETAATAPSAVASAPETAVAAPSAVAAVSEIVAVAAVPDTAAGASASGTTVPAAVAVAGSAVDAQAPESSDDEGGGGIGASAPADASGAVDGGDASGAIDAPDDRLPAPDPSALGGRPGGGGGGGGRRGRRGRRR